MASYATGSAREPSAGSTSTRRLSQELRREARYYERGQGLGDELTAEVERVTRDIREYRELGTPDSASTRRVKVHRFPFSIIYLVHAERTTLVAVAHHSRKPGSPRA